MAHLLRFAHTPQLTREEAERANSLPAPGAFTPALVRRRGGVVTRQRTTMQALKRLRERGEVLPQEPLHWSEGETLMDLVNT